MILSYIFCLLMKGSGSVQKIRVQIRILEAKNRNPMAGPDPASDPKQRWKLPIKDLQKVHESAKRDKNTKRTS
jgi:hypothetical protein